MANEESRHGGQARIKEQLTKAALGQEGQAASPQTTQGSPSLESQVQDLQKTLTPLGPTPKIDEKKDEARDKAGPQQTGGQITGGSGRPRKKKGRVDTQGQPIENQQLKQGRQRTPRIQQAAKKAAVSWGKRALAASLFGASIGGAFPFM